MRRNVVVIGASAGGLEALRALVARLPADLAASLLVVTHLSPTAPSRPAEVVNKIDAIPVGSAVDGQPLLPGRIVTAVPDRHLLIGEGDLLRLSRGPWENRVRPAVDALFRSAARWCGPRVIGGVLSGALDDGAAGLAAITQRGGLALVQRPEDARFPGMPTAALRAVPAAPAMPADALGDALAELVGQSVQVAQPEPPGSGDDLAWETEMTEHGRSTARHHGRPVALGCPECGGGMSSIETGNAVHYVCHAGHSYSPQTLLAARDEGIESSLWTAVSALQETVTVLDDLARRAQQSGDDEDYRRRRAAAAHASRAAELIRSQLMGDDRLSSTP
jgi:two-component system chemotaxis response regulator CheB